VFDVVSEVVGKPPADEPDLDKHRHAAEDADQAAGLQQRL
jgi:hypothetical protein